MSGTFENWSIGKYLRRVLIPGVAVLSLLFLFFKAQPVDPDIHNVLAGDLRELQKRDIELGEAVLQNHFILLHNYDGLNSIMQRMLELSAELIQHHKDGTLPDTPEVRRELSTIQEKTKLKADALEEFKSNNALVKNSLIYLPRTIDEMLEKLPKTYRYTSEDEQYELLLRNVMLMVINKDDLANENLKRTMDSISRNIPRLPERVKKQARLALKHTSIIIENEQDMKEILGLLGSSQNLYIGTRLEQIYLDYYKDQQHIANQYRTFLFMAAILILGYGVYAYYRIREEDQKLRIAATAFETQEGILITDLNHRIIRVNSAFTRLTGYSAEEAIGLTPEMLKSGLHDQDFYPNMWEDIAKNKFWQGEIRSRRKNGEIYLAWLTTTAVIADDDNRVTHYVSVFSDITMRKQAEEQIHQLAFYDSLTKLPNRRLLVDRLRHAMTAGIRKLDHGAILFIDLDNFKVLNDTRGHDVGDLMLVETARRLQECVRGADSVARLGGDEFIVMLEGLGAELDQAAAQARAVGEKIRSSLNLPYQLSEVEHHSSCSIGISLFRDHEITVDELLKRADTAMYEAKACGRNALRFFDPTMQAVLENRSMLEADLRNALAQQNFALFYQIQVNSDNQPIGAEALIRWIHPMRGVVMPEQFISLAEETGLIIPIGFWVLETACVQLKTWEANPLACGLKLAINVSGRQFHQPDFVEQVRRTLIKTGAVPDRLKLELTESVVLDDIDDTIAKMHELKLLGVKFSMDDFGTGYSSLSYLTQLPMDQLKIDQSFVRNIDTKHTDAVIVQTIIGMGNTLGMEVIAEGVETEEQRELLYRAGCTRYQGYLLSKPVPLQEFENALLGPRFPG